MVDDDVHLPDIDDAFLPRCVPLQAVLDHCDLGGGHKLRHDLAEVDLGVGVLVDLVPLGDRIDEIALGFGGEPVPRLASLRVCSKSLCCGPSPWSLVPKPIPVLRPGQPTEHQLNHADPDLRLAGISQVFIILAVNPAPTQPAEGSLHHPPPRQQLRNVPETTSLFSRNMLSSPPLGAKQGGGQHGRLCTGNRTEDEAAL